MSESKGGELVSQGGRTTCGGRKSFSHARGRVTGPAREFSEIDFWPLCPGPSAERAVLVDVDGPEDGIRQPTESTAMSPIRRVCLKNDQRLYWGAAWNIAPSLHPTLEPSRV
jgi:hypothetical protein